jgi:hypothetical protein
MIETCDKEKIMLSTFFRQKANARDKNYIDLISTWL